MKYHAAEVYNGNAGMSVNRTEGSDVVALFFLSSLEEEVDKFLVQFEGSDFRYVFSAEEVCFGDNQQAIFPDMTKACILENGADMMKPIPELELTVMFLKDVINKKGDFYLRFHTVKGETEDRSVSLSNSKEAISKVFTEDFMNLLIQ